MLHNANQKGIYCKHCGIKTDYKSFKLVLINSGGIKSKVAPMVRIIKGLQCHYIVSSRKSEHGGGRAKLKARGKSCLVNH